MANLYKDLSERLIGTASLPSGEAQLLAAGTERAQQGISQALQPIQQAQTARAFRTMDEFALDTQRMEDLISYGNEQEKKLAESFNLLKNKERDDKEEHLFKKIKANLQDMKFTRSKSDINREKLLRMQNDLESRKLWLQTMGKTKKPVDPFDTDVYFKWIDKRLNKLLDTTRNIQNELGRSDAEISAYNDSMNASLGEYGLLAKRPDGSFDQEAAEEMFNGIRTAALGTSNVKTVETSIEDAYRHINDVYKNRRGVMSQLTGTRDWEKARKLLVESKEKILFANQVNDFIGEPTDEMDTRKAIKRFVAHYYEDMKALKNEQNFFNLVGVAYVKDSDDIGALRMRESLQKVKFRNPNPDEVRSAHRTMYEASQTSLSPLIHARVNKTKKLKRFNDIEFINMIARNFGVSSSKKFHKAVSLVEAAWGFGEEGDVNIGDILERNKKRHNEVLDF